MTVRQLIDQLENCRNWDAVAVLCGPNREYHEITGITDETHKADKDGLVGNALLTVK